MKPTLLVTSRQVMFREMKDYLMIALGMILYGIGWTVFLLPNDITTGGVPGIASIVFWATGFPVPVQYQSGYPISGLEEAGKLATVFHAGTKGDGNGRILTAGGRVLGVTAVGGSLEKAIETAYAACKPIAFQDMHFRTDIGKV